MTFHLNPIEVLWIIVNAIAIVLTGIATLEALRDLSLARVDQEGHQARELAAFGNLRREILRLLVQFLLLSLALPGLFSDQPIPLTPFLVVLIAVPVVLLVSTLLDARDRTRLADLLVSDVRSERALLALESSVRENISLTRDVGDRIAALRAVIEPLEESS